MLADPFIQLIVLRVVSVFDRFQKVVIAEDATAVLGWARELASDTGRVLGSGVCRDHFLQNDAVFPAIAHIVCVSQFGADSAEQRGSPCARLLLESLP